MCMLLISVTCAHSKFNYPQLLSANCGTGFSHALHESYLGCSGMTTGSEMMIDALEIVDLIKACDSWIAPPEGIPPGMVLMPAL
jgi:hypothetical protein